MLFLPRGRPEVYGCSFLKQNNKEEFNNDEPIVEPPVIIQPPPPRVYNPNYCVRGRSCGWKWKSLIQESDTKEAKVQLK